jgi:hypothetical protein
MLDILYLIWIGAGYRHQIPLVTLLTNNTRVKSTTMTWSLPGEIFTEGQLAAIDCTFI